MKPKLKLVQREEIVRKSFFRRQCQVGNRAAERSAHKQRADGTQRKKASIDFTLKYHHRGCYVNLHYKLHLILAKVLNMPHFHKDGADRSSKKWGKVRLGTFWTIFIDLTLLASLVSIDANNNKQMWTAEKTPMHLQNILLSTTQTSRAALRTSRFKWSLFSRNHWPGRKPRLSRSNHLQQHI